MAAFRMVSLGAAVLPLLLAAIALSAPGAMSQDGKVWGAGPRTSIPNCVTVNTKLKTCTQCCNAQLCGASSFDYVLLPSGQCGLRVNFDDLPVPEPGYSGAIDTYRGFRFIGDANNAALIPRIATTSKATLNWISRANADTLVQSQPLGLYTVLHAADAEYGYNVAPHLFAMQPAVSGQRFDMQSFTVTAVMFSKATADAPEYSVRGTLKITGSTKAGSETVLAMIPVKTTKTDVVLGSSARGLLWIDFDFIAAEEYAGGDPELVFDNFVAVPKP